MKCAIAEQLLNDYIDGTLAPDLVASVEDHLASCQLCASRLAEMHSVISFIESLPPLDTQRDFTLQVMAQISVLEEPAPAAPSFSLIQILALPAAAGMAIMLLISATIAAIGPDVAFSLLRAAGALASAAGAALTDSVLAIYANSAPAFQLLSRAASRPALQLLLADVTVLAVVALILRKLISRQRIVPGTSVIPV